LIDALDLIAVLEILRAIAFFLNNLGNLAKTVGLLKLK